jgi:hypothetical protein
MCDGFGGMKASSCQGRAAVLGSVRTLTNAAAVPNEALPASLLGDGPGGLS